VKHHIAGPQRWWRWKTPVEEIRHADDTESVFRSRVESSGPGIGLLLAIASSRVSRFGLPPWAMVESAEVSELLQPGSGGEIAVDAHVGFNLRRL
jgi:hypothetical protein